MPLVKTETVHRRVHSRQFSWAEIKVLLAVEVANEAGVEAAASNVDTKVTYHAETEGSPGYQVGFGARVTITEDLSTPQALEATATRPPPKRRRRT